MNFLRRIRSSTKLKKLRKKLVGEKKSTPVFKGSKKYWENRYEAGRNSGAGSYGRLAEFKAEILNSFVLENSIQTVIEYGCGDGNQLALANYPKYTGYDVSKKAIALCKEKFSNDIHKEFSVIPSKNATHKKAELTLSLDVIYHLIEDKVFDAYMRQLFSASERYVIIYSSNYDDHFAPHVKCREFTKWIDTHIGSKWKLQEVIKNRYTFDEMQPDETSMADFYIYKKI